MTGFGRLARSVRHPRVGIRALRREGVVARQNRRMERDLAAAARTGGTVVIGPFLGEVGYELLYWIPFARHVLRLHGIPSERCISLTRGGAGVWYAGVADRSLELFDIVPHERLVEAMEERHSRVRDRKQLLRARLDDELLALVGDMVDVAAVLHPSLMYARLRSLWFRGASVEDAARHLDVAPLSVPPAGLPAPYVAVKLYASDHTFPDAPDAAKAAAAAVRHAAGVDPVVSLSTGLRFDDHAELEAEGIVVERVEHLLRAADNLAVQTSVVAGARALICTYGGFSYLGPLLGVPTLALRVSSDFHPAHLELADIVLPGGGRLLHVADVMDESDVLEAIASLGIAS